VSQRVNRLGHTSIDALDAVALVEHHCDSLETQERAQRGQLGGDRLVIDDVDVRAKVPERAASCGAARAEHRARHRGVAADLVAPRRLERVGTDDEGTIEGTGRDVLREGIDDLSRLSEPLLVEQAGGRPLAEELGPRVLMREAAPDA
jgi:hypothetical protein